MFFAGAPYNTTDPILNSLGGPERQDLLVKKLQDTLPDFEPDSKNGGLRSGALQGMIKD